MREPITDPDELRRVLRSWLFEDGPAPHGIVIAEYLSTVKSAVMSRSIDMMIFCPNCQYQHVDAPDPSKGWTNPPHRSHLCLKCGHVWRHCDVPTNGVVLCNTFGKEDKSPYPRAK